MVYNKMSSVMNNITLASKTIEYSGFTIEGIFHNKIGCFKSAVNRVTSGNNVYMTPTIRNHPITLIRDGVLSQYFPEAISDIINDYLENEPLNIDCLLNYYLDNHLTQNLTNIISSYLSDTPNNWISLPFDDANIRHINIFSKFTVDNNSTQIIDNPVYIALKCEQWRSTGVTAIHNTLIANSTTYVISGDVQISIYNLPQQNSDYTPFTITIYYYKL